MKTSNKHEDFFFIQMADIQFGLFADMSGADADTIRRFRSLNMTVRPAPKTTGFASETSLYTRAIEMANRLSPDFVVMCGDMTHNFDDDAQLLELQRLTGLLDNDIPMKWVAGNHDIGNNVTQSMLSLYRQRYGEDNYFFDHGGSRFIVLNSNLSFYPPSITGAWERHQNFLRSALRDGREGGSNHIFVFTHHPLFLEHVDEKDSSLTIPLERRRVLLDILRRYDTTAVFSGHTHVNHYARDGNMLMITSAAVGYPFGNDPSGFRIVKVYEKRIEHEYFGFDQMPSFIDMNNGLDDCISNRD